MIVDLFHSNHLQTSFTPVSLLMPPSPRAAAWLDLIQLCAGLADCVAKAHRDRVP